MQHNIIIIFNTEPFALAILLLSKVCKHWPNEKLVFLRFGNIQLPSSGNNNKEAFMHIRIRVMVTVNDVMADGDSG